MQRGKLMLAASSSHHDSRQILSPFAKERNRASAQWVSRSSSNQTALCAGCAVASDIENIQHGAIWYLLARTLRDRFTQQAFELGKIINLCADVFDVMVSDLPHLGA
jgi:hypothetical protein